MKHICYRKAMMEMVAVAALVLAGNTKAVSGEPLKVYILVGQSNMQGHAQLSTMPYMAEDATTRPLHDKLIDANGTPSVHDNVRIIAFSEAGGSNLTIKKGPLTIGYGSDLNSATVFGTELAFGVTMRDKTDGLILIIKTAWGGKSLNTDFRPPSAGKYELHPKIKALWEKHPDGAHGIPKEADRPKWHEAKDKATGHYYRLMMKHVKDTLANLADAHPEYDPKQGYELAGLVWFQGWNDMCDGGTYPDNARDPNAYAEYSRLLAHFIRDVRKDLNAPELPFVIGVIGVDGDNATGSIAHLRPAMAAPAEMPEFKGTVAAVQTKDFWDDRMAALEEKKIKVNHRLRAAHVIAQDGFMEPRDTTVPGWEVIGTPSQEDRVWRYISFDPIEKEQIPNKEKRRFRDVSLPAGLEDWYKPGFDDSNWQSGRAPIGKGTWKHGNDPLVQYHSEWGDGEFLLMRTTLTVDNLDYVKYRLAGFSRQGYHVYLNGTKIHTYVWWQDKPFYINWELDESKTQHLKTGKNVLAVYANCEYDQRTQEPFCATEIVLEGITEKALDYVNSNEYKLRVMDKECSREEGRIILGSSNGGYHYLGSGKMLSQIGEAFAEALLKLQMGDK